MEELGKFPLDGVRVIELAHIASGPFCGMLLGDLGADVVKIEPPGGEHLRKWPPFVGSGEGRLSTQFASLNRTKRSIEADLKNPADLAMVANLINRADVVIENFRPGVLDRLGLGYKTVTKGHRGLVYCSISGFGQTSPYRTKGAFDIIIQAMSGLMSVTGERGRSPVKSGVPFGDFVPGLYAAYTIVAMLPRARAGDSSYIDVPMLDCLLATSPLRTSEYFGTGEIPTHIGNEHPTNVPYQSFEASDGHFVVGAGNDRLWRKLCEAIGFPKLADEPRFATQEKRVMRRLELTEQLQAIFIRQPKAAWLQAIESRGVPCGPINNFAEILNDRHVRETELLLNVDVPGGTVPTVAFPCRSDRFGKRYVKGPPKVNAGRDSVLSDWGIRTEVP